MSNARILELFHLHKQQLPNSEIIIFCDCSPALKNMFENSEFLQLYVYNNNDLIVYAYDKTMFPRPEHMYQYLSTAIFPEFLEAFSYTVEQGSSIIEKYLIVHCSMVAELIIYHEDIASGLDIHSIEFNVNGMYMPMPNINTMHLNTMLGVYTFVTNFIETLE